MAQWYKKGALIEMAFTITLNIACTEMTLPGMYVYVCLSSYQIYIPSWFIKKRIQLAKFAKNQEGYALYNQYENERCI